MERPTTALLAAGSAIMLGLLAAQAVPTRPNAKGDDWRERFPAPQQADEYPGSDDYLLSDQITVPSGPPAWLFGSASRREDVPDYLPYTSSSYDVDLAPEPAEFAPDDADQAAPSDAARSDRAETSALAAASAANDVRAAEAAITPVDDRAPVLQRVAANGAR